jgi:hypothetical protein
MKTPSVIIALAFALLIGYLYGRASRDSDYAVYAQRHGMELHQAYTHGWIAGHQDQAIYDNHAVIPHLFEIH